MLLVVFMAGVPPVVANLVAMINLGVNPIATRAAGG
jgi:hypothetical protein